jgi:hypothetical protein
MKDMSSRRSPDAAANKPPVLSSAEIDQLLSMTLIDLILIILIINIYRRIILV